ncbi:hypothetical protein NL50_02135 [Clostridium acetobutylicum]|nr:hypothetical protein NL50_02135 [Clostridium acetobutylicum]
MINKIPKVLHYCWFGENPQNDTIKKCISSWKKYLSDYKFIEWNESNFDLTSVRFVKEAYENKKYAFVSDYLRLYVLYRYGGIYLDTDVEITNYLDKFLCHSAFSGFENSLSPVTGIMGSEKGNKWIKRLLSYYDDRSFYKEDGTLDITTNSKIIEDICVNEYGLVKNNKYQIIDKDVHIYPINVFCTPDSEDGNYAIHHFNASWLPIEKLREERITYLKCLHYNERELRKCKSNYEILSRFVDFYRNNYKSVKNKYVELGNVAIYGFGILGRELFYQLSDNGVIVKCIIDSNKNLEQFSNVKIILVDELNDYNNLDNIIVTPNYDFDNIFNSISKYTNAKIMSIQELM